MNEEALAALEGTLEALKAERTEIESAIRGLEVVLARQRKQANKPSADSVSAPLPGLGVYSRTGPTDVIRDILRKASKAMTAKQIFSYASAQGFQSNSKNAGNMVRSICERLVRDEELEIDDSLGKRAYKTKR